MIYLRDYASAEVAFSKARSPAKGRPIRSWCRLFKRGDHYEVSAYSWRRSNYVPLCTISPCNTLTFVADTSLILSLKQSLSTSLRRLMPIDVHRQRKGIYKFVWVYDARKYIYYGGATREVVAKYGAEYFPGLQFDMTTGECINRKPNALDTVDPAKRKEWLRIIIPYMRGIRARIKVGALDRLQADEKLKRSPKNPVQYTISLIEMVTNWEDEATQAMAYQCVVEGIYPPQFLQAIVRTIPLWGRHSNWDRQALYRATQTMQRHTSHNLRERFGVFTSAGTSIEVAAKTLSVGRY